MLTFKSGKTVELQDGICVAVPDGYHYSKVGSGDNQNWAYVVPENYSLSLNHIDAKPYSFGLTPAVAQLPVETTADKFESFKAFLAGNQLIDTNVSVYQLSCCEHGLFIYQQWYDAYDPTYNKINGFLFAGTGMYQIHFFLNRDDNNACTNEAAQEFRVACNDWMSRTSFAGEKQSAILKGDPNEAKYTLDDLSSSLERGKNVLPLHDGLSNGMRLFYAVAALLWYSKHGINIEKRDVDRLAYIIDTINGNPVSDTLLKDLLVKYRVRNSSIGDILDRYEFQLVLKDLVLVTKMVGAEDVSGLVWVYTNGFNEMIRVIASDHGLLADADLFSVQLNDALKHAVIDIWNSNTVFTNF